MHRLTVSDTLVDGPLAAATAHAGAVDAEPLFGLVAKAASLVRSGGTGHAADGGKLAVFPYAHAL